jgi:DNA-binding MarR family transcriptional regulator
MEPWLLGAIAGGTAAFAVVIAQRRTNKTTPEVLSILRDRGPLTIPEIMRELGLEGMAAQGRVVMALDTLIKRGDVDELPVDREVPRLERIKVRRYSMSSSVAPSPTV